MKPTEKELAFADAYIRVSSRSQNFATQRDAIERAAGARGDTIRTTYAEKKSAATLDRPELNRLRADAKAGKIRRLYLFRLDRLTRSGIKDTLEVVEELRAHGVELVNLADGFDMSSPAGELILAVMAWASKMERLARNERIAAARDRIEAAGGRWGRPRRMTDERIARALEMRDAGKSIRDIAIALKVPRATIGRVVASQNAAPKNTPTEPPDPPGDSTPPKP